MDVDFKAIVAKFGSTLPKLVSIWTSMGLEKEIQQNHITELEHKLNSIVDNLLAQEEKVHKDFETENKELRQQIDTLCAGLGIQRNEFDVPECTPLIMAQDELKTHLKSLKKVRL